MTEPRVSPVHVFGPVRSGRLGRSLGVDLLGEKICSFDCLYCEVKPTTRLTLERREWIPTRQLLDELRAWRDAGHALPDVITLGGSGEPTLHSGLGDIIAGCRQLFPGLPVAVLTNSSLLHLPEVRRELGTADMVLPSMDTLIDAEYRRLNRPHHQVDLQRMAEGLLAFRREYSGRIYLEILLSRGVNDSAANLAALKEYVQQLQPDRVDVVTLSRPGAYPEAQAVDRNTLARWREVLGGEPAAAASPAPRTVPPPEPAAASCSRSALTQAVLASLARRPQTAAQLAEALQVPAAALQAVLEKLQQSGHIQDRGSQTDDPSAHFFSAI
ncbi:radical SAM protein [Megalodesulfovibrio paquesii]